MSGEHSWQFISTPKSQGKPTVAPRGPQQPRSWEEELEPSSSKNWNWKSYEGTDMRNAPDTNSLFQWGVEVPFTPCPPLDEDEGTPTNANSPHNKQEGTNETCSCDVLNQSKSNGVSMEEIQPRTQHYRSPGLDSPESFSLLCQHGESIFQLTRIGERISHPSATILCDVHSSECPPQNPTLSTETDNHLNT